MPAEPAEQVRDGAALKILRTGTGSPASGSGWGAIGLLVASTTAFLYLLATAVRAPYRP
jgi:hypothetical protein